MKSSLLACSSIQHPCVGAVGLTEVFLVGAVPSNSPLGSGVMRHLAGGGGGDPIDRDSELCCLGIPLNFFL